MPGTARLVFTFIPILLLATFLRLYRLDAQSFWNDEGNTARLVERPISLIIAGAAGDIHPPGYYLLLHGWRALTGHSEFALRSFSAFCGILTVAVTAAIALRSPNPGRGKWLAAWGAATLVAVHPLSVYYSQEARMYAQLGLISALTLWGAIRLVAYSLKYGATKHVVLSGIELTAAIVAGLYTQYIYLLILAGLNAGFGLYWLTLHSKRWRLLGTWIGVHILGGLLFLPWAHIAIGVVGWHPPDLNQSGAITSMMQAMLAGITLPSSLPMWNFVSASILCLSAVVVSLTLPRETEERLVIWTALGMTLIPPALITMMGIYRPAYLKFLVANVAPLAIVLTTLLQASRIQHQSGSITRGATLQHLQRALGIVLLIPLLSTQFKSLHHLYTDPSFARDDYRRIAALIQKEGRPGDAILLNAPNQWEVFTYYYPQQGELPIYPAPYRPTEAEAESWVQGILNRHRDGRLFALFWGDLEADPGRFIERSLAENAFKASDSWITSVRLARYGTGALVLTPTVGLDAVLSPTIHLTGYYLPRTTWHAGDIVPLTLFWAAVQTPDVRLKVFVHLVNGAGQLVAQVDMEPHAGFLPTTEWPAGERITDHYGILLPAELPPGTYDLKIGMYDLSGERLPIYQRNTLIGDALTLEQLHIYDH